MPLVAEPQALSQPPNAIRMLPDPQLARPFVLDWERVARRLLSRIHRETLARPGDAALAAFMRQLYEYPGVPSGWRQLDFATTCEPVWSFARVTNRVRATLGGMTIALLGTALLGLLLFGLGAAVTVQRRRTRTYYACRIDPTDTLYRLIRAHGNTAEYAPMLSVLMLTAAQRGASNWVVMAIGLVTVSRYLHVIGMLAGPTLDASPNVFRLMGAPGTYLGGLVLCLAILGRV